MTANWADIRKIIAAHRIFSPSQMVMKANESPVFRESPSEIQRPGWCFSDLKFPCAFFAFVDCDPPSPGYNPLTLASLITAPTFDINLASTLSEDRVIADTLAEDRPGVIAELLERLDSLNAIPRESRATLLTALLEKENIHTTGIGSGVAIPHCYSDAVSETVFVFGRSLQGIDFNAPDGEPVHYILLYLVPQDRHLLHLQTLRAVAKNFLSSKLRRQLLEAPDAAAILEVFRKHAER